MQSDFGCISINHLPVDETKMGCGEGNSWLLVIYLRMYPFVNVCKWINIFNPKPKHMIIEAPSKTCQACNKAIRGRTDKKFCDDYCRNVFNNKIKSTGNNTVRNINNALRRNRRILQELIRPDEKMTKTKMERLVERGFLFKYITHTYINPKGKLYNFCFEYGYLPLENNNYVIVKQKEG